MRSITHKLRLWTKRTKRLNGRVFSACLLLFFVFAMLGPLAAQVIVNKQKASADATGDLVNQITKLTWVGQNQIKVELTTPLYILNFDGNGNNFDVRSEQGTTGIFTQNPDNGNEFKSGHDVCGGKQVGKKSQDAQQSTLTRNGDKWSIAYYVDTVPDDVSTGCGPVDGDVKPPVNDLNTLKGEAYWINRTALTYNNETYQVQDCYPFNPMGSIGGNKYGQGLRYKKDNKELIADVGSDDGKGYYTGPDGQIFSDINIVKDHDGPWENSKTAGYKIDDSTIFMPCGLRTGGGPLWLAEGVANSTYKLPPQTDANIAGHAEMMGKYFRVENGAQFFQDWIKIGDGGNATIETTSNDGQKANFNIVLANNGANSVPPTNLYPDVAKIIAAGNTGQSIPAAGSGSGTAADTSPRCESGGLSWAICPIINLLANGSDYIFTSLIKPALQTDRINTSRSDPIFTAWSSVRFYGDALLIVGMLVVVFGQSIGGGLIDAYTAKKVLPRILAAAVMINLSIYIVAILVDITNIVGNGINGLFTGLIIGSPTIPGTTHLALSLNGGASAFSVAALVGGGAAIWVLGASLIQAFLLFVLLPLFFALIAVIITIIIRRGLIMLLIIISPIAFALYCLPNTEQYFRKWWKLLFEALLVYPIVGAVFGIANLLSYTINAANTSGGVSSGVAQLISLVVLVIPLFLIPYSFKLAGGVLGNLHAQFTNYKNKAHQGILGNANDPRSARNRARYGMRSRYNDRRGEAYSKLTKDGAGDVRHGRFSGGAARLLNYGNLQAERSMMNEEQDKLIAAQYSMGDDSNVRALWAKQYTGPDEAGPKGRKSGRYYSPYASGDGTYKEWSSADVAKANSIVAKDPSRLQSYAKYEYGKAADDGQQEAFEGRLLEKADEYGYSNNQMAGVWGGIKFAHQNTRKERKYMDPKKNTDTNSPNYGKFEWGAINHHDLSRELDDSITKGAFAGYRPSTAIAAREGFQEAQSRLNANAYTDPGERARDMATRDHYQSIADNLETSLFGFGASSEGARRAAEVASVTAAGAEGAADPVGFGMNASAAAEREWRAFVQVARTGRGPAATPPPPAPAPPADHRNPAGYL